jgi:hypothetical protein
MDKEPNKHQMNSEKLMGISQNGNKLMGMSKNRKII